MAHAWYNDGCDVYHDDRDAYHGVLHGNPLHNNVNHSSDIHLSDDDHENQEQLLHIPRALHLHHLQIYGVDALS